MFFCVISHTPHNLSIIYLYYLFSALRAQGPRGWLIIEMVVKVPGMFVNVVCGNSIGQTSMRDLAVQGRQEGGVVHRAEGVMGGTRI